MKKKRRQLRWNMTVMLLICWLLPTVLLSAVIFFFVNTKINRQLEDIIVTSADKAVEICQMRVGEAIDASKASSYLPAIRESYERYEKDGNHRQLSQDVSVFMSQQYRYNPDINMSALYFTAEPENIYYCYSNNNMGGGSVAVSAFKEHAKDAVQRKAGKIDTSIEFMSIEDRVYLVRNIMDSSFNPYAVIIIELNINHIVDSLKSIWGYVNGDIFVDGKSMLNFMDTDPLEKEYPERIMEHSHYSGSDENAYVYKRVESNRHKYAFFVELDSGAIVNEMETMKYIFYMMLAFIVPLLFAVFHFFHSHVNMPIRTLRDANKEIEKENYGYQVDLSKSDEEFFDLGESFNSMSSKLKNQFEKIYLEELALKEANIMALQSQINPHFLNNTLEIINWEVRMAGNYKVSGMIEALSTMLEATMNRRRERLISLSEELSYVEAYLYIIAQRFGDNFVVEKAIDEKLLRIKVPRLIIQPIVENAVEHGMDIRRKGKIRIVIRREGDKLLIEIMDNGRLTEADKEKIDKLLNADNTNETLSLSLGIRNVNKRLKIIYGKDCGLTIKSDKNQYTVSTIIVKIDKEGEQ